MENNNHLQKMSDSNIVKLTNKEIEISGEIYEVNQLAPYPLSSIQIEDWARSLNRLLPNLEISTLSSLIDDFKRDNIEWDYKKGIQNIFIGLRSYERKMVY
jgi:hypothetical protein